MKNGIFFHLKIYRIFCLGEDLSEAKDHSIIRRTLKKGEGYTKPNDGASVEVTLKGTFEDRVFDERTVSFIVGEGFLQNIPEGFEMIIALKCLSIDCLVCSIVSNMPSLK